MNILEKITFSPNLETLLKKIKKKTSPYLERKSNIVLSGFFLKPNTAKQIANRHGFQKWLGQCVKNGDLKSICPYWEKSRFFIIKKKVFLPRQPHILN